MKIAYIINSLEAGGAQFPIPRIAKALEARGVSFKVYGLSRRNGLAIPALDAAGIDWTCSDLPKSAHWRAARWLRAQIEADAPDILWTSLSQATLLGQRLGRRFGLPVVSWQHNAFLKPANRILLRRQVGLSAFWVADSQSVMAFTKDTLGVRDADLLRLPLFVADPEAPQAEPERPSPFHWVSVGRLHRNKGYDLLLEALEPLADTHNFRLTLFGTGSEEDALRAQSAKLGLKDRVDFAGFRTDIPDCLATASAYVQPSRNEGLCIAAHEAMAAGLPCVVSRTGEMPLTLGDIGTSVAVGDVDALRTALDATMRERHGLAARGHATRARVLDLYAEETFDCAVEALLTRMEALVA